MIEGKAYSLHNEGFLEDQAAPFTPFRLWGETVAHNSVRLSPAVVQLQAIIFPTWRGKDGSMW